MCFIVNAKRFIREGPELRICVIVNPECLWNASHYLRRERLVENATCAPGFYKQSSRDIANFNRHVQRFRFRNIVLDESDYNILSAAVVGFEFQRSKEVHRIFGVRFFVHVFTVLFLGFWGFQIFCFWQTLAKWFINPQLLHVLPFAMHLSRWFGSQFPPQFEQYRGGRFPCLLKLFQSDQFDDRELAGNWIVFTLAGMRVLLCCCIWCWFCIPSSILIANSSAYLRSTKCLRSSFWTLRSTRLVIKTSSIKISSLFPPKSQFSANSLSLP